MRRSTGWIITEKRQKNILVHCRYGIGRTGTVVLIDLLHCGVSYTQVPTMMKHTPSWPSTNAQKNFTDRYITGVLDTRDHSHAALKSPSLIGRFFKRLKAISKWDD